MKTIAPRIRNVTIECYSLQIERSLPLISDPPAVKQHDRDDRHNRGNRLTPYMCSLEPEFATLCLTSAFTKKPILN